MLDVIRKGSPEESEFILQKLIEYNLSHAPFARNPPWTKLCLVSLNEHNTIIGGINASLVWDYSLSIHHLWVDASYRGQGLGSKLLQQLEHNAQDAGAKMAHLDTLDFQARGFYERHGYEVFGVLEGSPCQGHQRYYMKKALPPGASA